MPASEDDAENARNALRALWSMSGQMDDSETLGQEQEGSAISIPTGKGTRYEAGDDSDRFGGQRHDGLGFADFAQTNEPTFNRGEAATKFREAWKSQLAMDGKIPASSKSLKDSAAKVPEKP